MRGSKGGLGDLKRLQAEAQARRQDAARPAAIPAATPAAAHGATPAGRARTGTPAVGRAPAADATVRQPAPASDSDPTDALQAFQQAMRHVAPLRGGERVVHTHRAGTDEIHAQRRAAALGETARRADAGVSDGDVAHLLSEGGTAYVRADAAPDTARKLRRGNWQAGAELDLHGLRVEQARHALLSFIDECLEHGIRCVRVVHGKGYGSEGLTPVLKDKARTWLVQKKPVIAFSEAPEREGGAGALLVLLSQAEDARR